MEPSPVMHESEKPQGGPVTPLELVTGSSVSARLEPGLAIAREWAGDGLEALVLSGSHASGEAAWAEIEGRTISLSDIDLYAVMRDTASAAAATARARAGRPGLAARLLASGLAAPLEVGFLTRVDLSRQGARPGTLELSRSGRVVWGDPTVSQVFPRWNVGDVPFEEVRLLLENRAFELLDAFAGVREEGLTQLRARHAVLKSAADLASVLCLARGEWPEGSAARVAWASEHVLPQLDGVLPGEWGDAIERLPLLWREALAWRSGAVRTLDPKAARAEWLAAVRCWCAVWWLTGDEPRRGVWERVLAVAARAPLRRRARQAVGHAPRSGRPEPALTRLKSWLAGTPQHRVNGSASALLLAAASSASPSRPALPVGALRVLRALGVTAARDWDAARADVLRAWDERVLDGQRTAGDA
ncbi:MAG: hypothetical protein HZA61_13160 [Candidatus Eisenbacteria bacterium]|uniref:Nucleotidyltransferase family protein n=1 Tax=Eiseniibacteriota bacterium TaxID=2212470 RepID=A0A933SD99_UNCEI|nr:hypothetical protein [Candidatus Eisenbacteria bacterium]